MGERPGQLFITPVDWKMQGINEWIKAGKAEFSSHVSGFSSTDFPPSPVNAAGGFGPGRSSPSEVWVAAAPLSINSVYHGCSQHGPHALPGFPLSPRWVSWGNDMCAQHSNFSSQWLCTWLWHHSPLWGQAWPTLGEKTLPTPSPPTHPATDRGKTEASPKIVGGKKGAS